MCLPYYSSKSNLQPPIELASILSCANVNDDNITDFYMELFGLKPTNNGMYIRPILNGSDRHPIMQLYVSSDGIDTGLLEKYDIEPLTTDEQAEFIENFRKVASSPVGRVLLYRLAIELLRYNADNIEFCDASIKARGYARGIWICKCRKPNNDAFCHLGNEELQSIIRLSTDNNK